MNVKSISLKFALAALMLLLAAIFISAGGGVINSSAATVVRGIELSFREPDSTKEVDFAPTIVEGTGFYIGNGSTTYETINYRVGEDITFYNGVAWYNVTKDKFMTASDKFEKNCDYKLYVRLKAKSGYYFEPNYTYCLIYGSTYSGQFGDFIDSGSTTLIYEVDVEYFEYERYDLYVGNTRVGANNASDITGNGMFSYDKSTSTLHIKEGTYNAGDYDAITFIDGWARTISVDGNATIMTNKSGIVSEGGVKITGKNLLSITAGKTGISGFSITIRNANLSVNAACPIREAYSESDDYDTSQDPKDRVRARCISRY